MGNQIIGSRIEERRKQLGMTLDDVARELGVAKSTIQRYEKGTIDKVKLPVIEAIARVISVNPAWICGKTDIMEPPKIRIKDKVREWKSNKSARLYMCIDSGLLDLLEKFSKEDGISLEEEIEKILYEDAEARCEDVAAEISYTTGIDPAAATIPDNLSTEAAEALYRSSSGYVPSADLSASNTIEGTSDVKGA